MEDEEREGSWKDYESNLPAGPYAWWETVIWGFNVEKLE